MKDKNLVFFFVWLFLMQITLWLLSLGSVSLLFLGAEGIVELIALSSLALCFFWGYILSKRKPMEYHKPIMILYLIWIIVPAVLIYFTQDSGIGWTVSFPYRSIAQTLFSSCFNSPRSAFVLDFIQPFLVACSYILTLFAFGAGGYLHNKYALRHQNTR